MRKNVLIMDADAAYIEQIKKMLDLIHADLKVYTAEHISSAYELLMEVTIDIFIVETAMNTDRQGDVSGMQLIERVREIPRYVLTPVIFIAKRDAQYMYAYTELNCLAYLKKPCSFEALKKAVEKALHYPDRKEEEKTLMFRNGGIVYPVKVKDIIYIESVYHVLSIYQKDGTKLEVPYRTFRKMLAEADSDKLVQCSRSVAVNKDYVLCIDVPNRYIEMKGNKKIEIGSTYKKKILEEFGK